jgi:hypothetical protein
MYVKGGTSVLCAKTCSRDEMPPFLILSDEDRGKIKQKPKPLVSMSGLHKT